MLLNVYKQTFNMSHGNISQKIKDVLTWNLLSYEIEDIARFSNLH